MGIRRVSCRGIRAAGEARTDVLDEREGAKQERREEVEKDWRARKKGTVTFVLPSLSVSLPGIMNEEHIIN